MKQLLIILFGAILFLASPAESNAQAFRIDSVMVYGDTLYAAPNQPLAKAVWFYHNNDSSEVYLAPTLNVYDNNLRFGGWKKKLISGIAGPIPIKNLKELVFTHTTDDDTTKIYLLWRD